MLNLACKRAQTHNLHYSESKLVFIVLFRGGLLRMQAFNATQDTFTLVVLKKQNEANKMNTTTTECGMSKQIPYVSYVHRGSFFSCT